MFYNIFKVAYSLWNLSNIIIRIQLIIFCPLSIILGLLEAVQVVLAGFIFQQIIFPSRTADIYLSTFKISSSHLGYYFFIVVLITFVLRLNVQYFNLKLSRDLTKYLLSSFVKYIERSNFQFFMSKPKSDLQITANQFIVAIGNLSSSFLALLGAIILLVSIAISLIYVSPPRLIGIILIATMLIVAFNVILIQPLVKSSGKIAIEKNKNSHEILNLFLEDQINIRLKQSVGYYQKKACENKYISLKSAHFINFINFSQKSFYEFLILLAGSLVLILDSNESFVLSGNISATLGTYIVGLLRIIPALSTLIGSIHAITFNKYQLESYLDLVNKLRVSSDGFSCEKVPGEIYNCDFRSSSISLNIYDSFGRSLVALSKGDILLITGKSGIGKTTLLNSLAGLCRSKFNIYINSIDLYYNASAQFRKDYMKCVGYLSQSSPPIQSLSLCKFITDKEYVSLTTDEINWYEYCLEQSCLNDDNDLPLKSNGLRSICELSGGQAQRICIARQLYSKPKVLILDEFTSALDASTSRILTSNISKFSYSQIIIIVSHVPQQMLLANKKLELT